jgi:hypothetical protein
MDRAKQDYYRNEWGIDVTKPNPNTGETVDGYLTLDQGSWGLDEVDLNTNLEEEALIEEAARFAEAVEGARADLRTFMQQNGIPEHYIASPKAITRGQELVKKYQLDQWLEDSYIARNPEVMGRLLLDREGLEKIIPGVTDAISKRTAQIIEIPRMAAE